MNVNKWLNSAPKPKLTKALAIYLGCHLTVYADNFTHAQRFGIVFPPMSDPAEDMNYFVGGSDYAVKLPAPPQQFGVSVLVTEEEIAQYKGDPWDLAFREINRVANWPEHIAEVIAAAQTPALKKLIEEKTAKYAQAPWVQATAQQIMKDIQAAVSAVAEAHIQPVSKQKMMYTGAQPPQPVAVGSIWVPTGQEPLYWSGSAWMPVASSSAMSLKMLEGQPKVGKSAMNHANGGGDIVGGQKVVADLRQLVPGIDAPARCPSREAITHGVGAFAGCKCESCQQDQMGDDGRCGYHGAIREVIVHLNDGHRWTRNAVADWLESLDVDLTFRPAPPEPPLWDGSQRLAIVAQSMRHAEQWASEHWLTMQECFPVLWVSDVRGWLPETPYVVVGTPGALVLEAVESAQWRLVRVEKPVKKKSWHDGWNQAIDITFTMATKYRVTNPGPDAAEYKIQTKGGLAPKEWLTHYVAVLQPGETLDVDLPAGYQAARLLRNGEEVK